jgi:hypothetical protein
MKSLLLAAALAAGFVPVIGITAVSADTRHEPVVVTVSCFRGPWHVVIIDQPNQVFIDSLIAAGYSSGQAYGISMRVCRDQASVGNVPRMVSETYRLLNEERR